MKTRTKKLLIEFAVFLILIGAFDGIIALCNHWFRINGWNTKVLMPLVIIGIYVNYKLWRRLCRCLDNYNKS